MLDVDRRDGPLTATAQHAMDELRLAVDRAQGGAHLSEWFDDRIHLHPYRLPPFVAARPPRERPVTDLIAEHWDVTRPKLLYIHIPFCSSICPYCPFTKQRANDQAIDAYLAALYQQISDLASAVGESALTRSTTPVLYFGGGSPTSLSADELCRLASHAARSLHLSEDPEVTFELRIADLSDDYLARVVDDSVATRLSFGVQSFMTDRRASLGRRAAREQVLETLEQATKSSKVVNVDLMYGLPDQRTSEWADELDTMLSTGAQACSTYRLNVHEPTRFGLLSRQGLLANRPDRCAELDMFEIAEHKLVDNFGWRPFTPANYGDPRVERGLYNFAQLDHNFDIVGLGVGAHGQIASECYSTPTTLNGFLDSERPGGVAKVRSLGDRYLDARDLLCLTVGQTVKKDALTRQPHVAQFLSLLASADMVAETSESDVALTRRGLYWSRNLFYTAQRVLGDCFEASLK